MPGTPQKRKRTANHQISPEIGKNCQTTNETHTFPTHSHYGQREFFGRKWREYGRNRGADAKLGKPLEESQVVCFFFRAFPRGEIILEVLEMPGTPEKQKGSCYNHKTNPEIGKKNSDKWQPNILLFPLIPTKARTTNLAQKLEKHPRLTKTMFSQWVAERTFV